MDRTSAYETPPTTGIRWDPSFEVPIGLEKSEFDRGP
jgi:hypothetical protein